MTRVALPTGLTPAEVRALRRAERVAIATWHETVAGTDQGQEWLPAAVRELTPAARLWLAGDPARAAAWAERERRRAIADVAYFIRGYGQVASVVDDMVPGSGGAIPFVMWPEQEAVLDVIQARLRVVVLKARQLGLTWLALHAAVHLMLLDRRGASATVLALSQNGDYAKSLLQRARGINDRLPPFLKGTEDPDTRNSKSEWRLRDRGYMRSLAGTPEAPRTFQADLAICDEWAFVRHGNAGPTMTALLPAARRIVAISSGNGGPDDTKGTEGKKSKPADGAYFAKLYTEAREQRNGWTAVFLPTSTHPARTAEWRERERAQYDTEEDFLAEHPEDDDEALIGSARDRFFKPSEITAAVALGAKLDAALGTAAMTPPVGGTIDLGIDWGANSSALPIWGLEQGGIYVPPAEVVRRDAEIGEFTDLVHSMVRNLERRARHRELLPALRIAVEHFDAAGKQSNKTFTRTALAPENAALWETGRPRPHKIAFGSYKQEVANYLRRLFTRVGTGETVQVIAISPTNTELIRQLRGLQSDGTGLWEKDDDHGPDSLIAGAQTIARRHRQARTTT